MKKTFEIDETTKFAKKDLIGRDLLEMREKAIQMIARLRMPFEFDDSYPFVSKGEAAILRHLEKITRELEGAFVDFGVWKYGIKPLPVNDDVAKNCETPDDEESSKTNNASEPIIKSDVEKI